MIRSLSLSLSLCICRFARKVDENFCETFQVAPLAILTRNSVSWPMPMQSCRWGPPCSARNVGVFSGPTFADWRRATFTRKRSSKWKLRPCLRPFERILRS